MKAQDIEFVKTEAMSIKTDGYAKRSKLPRKTANAIIVRKLSETVDTGKPRSDYVNVLMEIGVSRRSAYRLVGEAYKAKTVTSDNAAKVPKAPAIQTVAADVRSVQSDGADHPTTTPAPRVIQWPDEVEKAASDKILPPLGDIVTGIWRVGIMNKEGGANKDEYRQSLTRCEANLTRYVGKFSRTVLNRAFHAGRTGEAPPFGRLISIKTESPDFDIPELAGKRASVFLPEKTKIPLWGDERKERINRINAMVTEGDEVAAFRVDGERFTDRDGKVIRFDKLDQAMEFVMMTNEGVAVVIHPQ